MNVDVTVPSPGESVTSVQVLQWFVEDGAAVERDAPLVELETEKATLVVSAEVAGRVSHLAAVGQTLAVGAVVARIEAGSGAGALLGPPAAASAGPSSPAGAPRGGPPSPAAAKILRERGVDPATVPGTGRGGRITRADALAAPLPSVAASVPAGPAAPAGPPVGARPARPGEHREPLSSLRQALARRLVAVRNETAMLTTFNEIDLDPVQRLRHSIQAGFQAEHGVKLGFMSIFARAACVALAEWPRVNAFIEGYEIVGHDYVDLGVAVSTDRGLLVPVVRGAHAMGMGPLEREIQRLATRAREGRITLEDLSGGTFTITNGGVFGSLLSTPILNPPQSAILGMHAIQDRPVARDGQVVIRPMMYVALSYDHRIIDGREAVSFLKRIKTAIEDPETLLGGP